MHTPALPPLDYLYVAITLGVLSILSEIGVPARTMGYFGGEIRFLTV